MFVSHLAQTAPQEQPHTLEAGCGARNPHLELEFTGGAA